MSNTSGKKMFRQWNKDVQVPPFEKVWQRSQKEINGKVGFAQSSSRTLLKIAAGLSLVATIAYFTFRNSVESDLSEINTIEPLGNRQLFSDQTFESISDWQSPTAFLLTNN